jgi:hypothetical protein
MPPELLVELCDYLHVPDVIKLRTACKQLQGARIDHLWQRQCERLVEDLHGLKRGSASVVIDATQRDAGFDFRYES